MPSADLAEASKIAVKARTINNGQSCIAAKRFIVHQSIASEFENRFVRGMQALVIDDPANESTELGPLATASIRETLAEQVDQTIRTGAKLLTGGMRLERPGFYYAPTVLADVPKDSPAYREELFGPVAVVFRVRNLDEAIQLANDTEFGLGASAWTNEAGEQARLIDEIQSGLVFINGMVASDPRLPFGGVKHSGYGRELSIYGIREFVNIKTVWIKSAGEALSGRTE
jgi:succinate-semialdehyde dehydrogenase/glutarate-semialdehyde dehydrogenase